MNDSMRTVVTAMGLLLMGMASVTVAGDMMENKEAMKEETMMDHKGMEEMMPDNGMEKETMTEQGEGKTMMEEMHKEQEMADEMKDKM
jgi:hypothetical protein